MDQNKQVKDLSLQAFQRMPYYLQYLKELYSEGATSVSAPSVSSHFGFSEIQVRKDFAAASSSQGKPKYGFEIKDLIDDIENLLGCQNTNEAALVGVGSLGRAFLQYGGFDAYGLKIVAAFDKNEELIGKNIHDKCILSVEKISDICRRMKIHIGIITVPAEQAQIVCDQLVAGGVLAIWNFAQVHLSVPKDILVQNENMAASLALLSKHLREKMQKGKLVTP